MFTHGFIAPVEKRAASPYTKTYEALGRFERMAGTERGDVQKGSRRIIEILTSPRLDKLPARLALGVRVVCCGGVGVG